MIQFLTFVLRVQNMLIKCVTACDSCFKEFGIQTSKNDQEFWKLVVCMYQSAFACFMCCFVSKMIGEYTDIQIDVLRVEMYGQDYLRTTLRFLEEDKKICKNLPRQCQTTPLINGQWSDGRPIKWGFGSTLICGRLYPK